MIGDDIAAALPELQAQAESMMRETCVVRRPAGFEEGPDGLDVPAYLPDAIYEGPCKRKTGQVAASEELGAGETMTSTRTEVHVPAREAGKFLPGDVAFFAAVAYRILEDHIETWQTACRLPVERVR